MPYRSIEDLPDSVRLHLPPHAREIYVAAFNNAWRQHEGDPDGEAAVHRIAWAAVKRRYHKVGDTWLPLAPGGWG
jgi:cation transport regulator